MCECEVCERSDLWQRWPNHTTLSITNDGMGSRLLFLSHTLLLHQSTAVHIMDIRSKLNFYYFQMSTSKCVETCQFQHWIITYGPPEWELGKKGVSFPDLFCAFLCISVFLSLGLSIWSASFSNSLPVTIYFQSICLPVHVWINYINIGSYDPLWLLFHLFSLSTYLSVEEFVLYHSFIKISWSNSLLTSYLPICT